jgi:hypothetical protein
MIFIRVRVRVVVGEAGERGKGDENQEAGKTFHDEPQE